MANAKQNPPPPPQQTTSLTVGNKNTLRDLLDDGTFRESLALVASKYMTAKRVAKVAMLAASRQPKLFDCTKASFLSSIIKAAEAGLDFGGVSGQGYLVPFRNNKKGITECQFIPGYQGFIELAYRAGRVEFIDAQLVYAADKFEYSLGSDPKVVHVPSLASDRGELVCAYAVARLKGSTMPKIEVMGRADLEAIRARSKAQDEGPWKTDPGEMYRKCPIRRIWKMLPKTPEVIAAIEADNVQFETDGMAANLVDGPIGTDGCRDRMTKAVASKQVEPPPPPPPPQPAPVMEQPVEDLGHEQPVEDPF